MSEDSTKKPEDAKAPTRHSDARRRLLKTIAVGGAAGAAVPDKWTKPVVDDVLLPAHADATGCQCAITSVNVNVDADFHVGGDSTTSTDRNFNVTGNILVDGQWENDDAVVVVTAQLPSCVPNGTGQFMLAVNAVGDLNVVGGDQNANANGGVVTFPNVQLNDVDNGEGFRAVITPPDGCGSPREIVVTFLEAID